MSNVWTVYNASGSVISSHCLFFQLWLWPTTTWRFRTFHQCGIHFLRWGGNTQLRGWLCKKCTRWLVWGIIRVTNFNDLSHKPYHALFQNVVIKCLMLKLHILNYILVKHHFNAYGFWSRFGYRLLNSRQYKSFEKSLCVNLKCSSRTIILKCTSEWEGRLYLIGK